MAIPGLPALGADIVIAAVELLTSDVISLFGPGNVPQWGLFLNGEPVIIADNVIAFEFKQDFRISNYPVEEGSFQTFNKVAVPFDVRLRFSTGGSLEDREALISSVDEAVKSLDLFDAVTPEKVYQSINPVHWDMRRTSRNGVGLVIVDLYCEQVIVTAAPQFANSQTPAKSPPQKEFQKGMITITPVSCLLNAPKSASAAPQVSSGTVQTTPAAPGQLDLSQALP
jgi:hypothetical protein